ncbi:MAG: endonuclease/exonuclease/phosphatase family protein [Candidatus Saccharibacteria bacterium]|nr:endonuclease/exonuclease/phosphatase family protein [Candidatus Saccharibacteria bacterium]
MENTPNKSLKEVVREGWKPFLAKAALLGTIAWGANEYMYPEDTTVMTHEAAEPLDDDELTIMTANVRGWDEGRMPLFETFKDTLDEYNPDIVCLQEVKKGEELTQLYEQERYNVVYATTTRYPFYGESGNAILSKPPLLNVDVEYLPNSETGIPRNAIMFEVQTKQNSLFMTATHLGLNQQERALQADAIMGKAEERQENVNLCGDLNAVESEVGSWSLDVLAAGVSYGPPTHPAWSPTRAIDHVDLACGDELFDQREVIDIGSDHLAFKKTYVNIADC